MSNSNKTLCLVLVLIFLTSLVTIQPATVKAHTKTIIVPDDYPTIASAIGNATSGDTIFIKEGTYSGPMYRTLEIDKSLSIIGEGADSTKINLLPSSQNKESDTLIPDWENPINPYGAMKKVHLNTTTWATSLIIDANDVKISNISINSPGDAFISGDRNQIISSKIAIPQVSLSGSYLSIIRDSFSRSLKIVSDSALLIVNGSYLTVSENKLTSLSVYGSYLNISDNTVLGNMNLNGEYCKVSENRGGGLTIEGSNIEISRNHVNTVNVVASNCFAYSNNASFRINGDGNIIAGNNDYHNYPFSYGTGISLVGSNNSIYANEITHNDEGLVVSGKNNIIYANDIANNTWGINVEYGAATIYQNNFINDRCDSTINPMNQPYFFDNGTLGNYWSDYGGFDANKDGVGDEPYVIGDNRSDRYPLMVPFDIGSVKITVPEWVAAYSAILSATLSPTPIPTLTPAPTPTPTITGSFMGNNATLLGAILIVNVVAIGAGLIVYFKKRKGQTH
jgi:nitrous oxidase accessory protein NosD